MAEGPTDAGFFDHWSPDAKAALAAASPFGRLGTARDTAGVADCSPATMHVGYPAKCW
ncbi:hypothetical protein ACMX25_22125 [Caballeronia sp. 15715]